ncbi:MAG: hypothetical protein WHT81_06780, partial [Rectinemataceae bacterium]
MYKTELPLSSDDKDNAWGRNQQGNRACHSPNRFRRRISAQSDRISARFDLFHGKKTGSMPILTHAEQHNIKAG